MVRSSLILASPDPACGKVFHRDRRSAQEHRIALEVWNRATGDGGKNSRLAIIHCKRCGGFHLGQRRINRPEIPDPTTARPLPITRGASLEIA